MTLYTTTKPTKVTRAGVDVYPTVGYQFDYSDTELLRLRATSSIRLPSGSDPLFTPMPAQDGAKPAATPSTTPIISESREPLPTDDITNGLDVGYIWRGPSGARVNVKSTAGRASWQPATSQALPIDAIGGAAPVAAYGVKRLGSAVATAAMNVVRASDNTAKDIAFLPGVADLDEMSLDGFTGGVTGRVAKLYEQMGSGNDATAAAALQPAVSPRSRRHGRAVIFDTLAPGTTGPVFDGGASCGLTIPSAVSVPGNGHTVLFVGRYLETLGSSVPAMELGGSSKIGFGYVNQFQHVLMGTGPVYFNADPEKSPINAGVMGWTSGSTGTRIVKHNKIVVGASAMPAAVLAGGTIGLGTLVAGSGSFELLGMLIYARTFTDAELARARVAFVNLFRLTPQVRDQWTAMGDSITYDFGAVVKQGFVRQAAELIPSSTPLRVYCAGIPGVQVASMVANYPAFYQNILSTAARFRIATMSGGINDLHAGTKATALFALTKQWCALSRAAGYNKLGIATVMPSGTCLATPAIEAERQAYNTLLRQGWTGIADVLIDVAADDAMGSASAPPNPLLFRDTLHPADLGHTHMAAIYAAAVQSLLT